MRSASVLLLFVGIQVVFAAQLDSTVRMLPPSEVRIADLPEPVHAALVLSPRDWEGSGLSLADILATQAGITTHRTGGLGSTQGISIRGMGTNQVVICVDGVPLGSAGSGIDLGSMDLSQYARIEVYKGHVPARFGGNGMGGVVNLVSRVAAGRSGRLQTYYGSHSTQSASLQIAAPWTDSLSWTSTLSERSSANDYEFLDRNGTPYNEADDRTVRRTNADFFQVTGNHSLRFAHASGASSTLIVSHGQVRAGLPGREEDQTVTAGTSQTEARAHYQWEASPGILVPGAAVFAHTERNIMHWYYPLDKIGLATDAHMRSGALAQGGGLRLGLAYQADQEGNLFAETQLEGSGERLLSRDYSDKFAASPWELDHMQAQLSARTAWRPLQVLQIESEGLYRMSHDRFSGGALYSSLFENRPASTVLRHLYSGRGTIVIGPKEGAWHGFAAVGRYFRSPEPLESYGTRAGILPNPDLKAETGVQGESGLAWQRNKTQARLTFFFNEARQRIQYVTSGSLSKPFNMGETRTQGIEAQIAGKPIHWLDLQANATWQEPRDRSGQNVYNGNIIPDEPTQAYAASAILHLPASIEIQWKGEARSHVYRDRANQQRIPAQTTHHATISYAPVPGGKLRLSAINLGGAEYQDIYAAWPTPGRQYSIGYTQDF